MLDLFTKSKKERERGREIETKRDRKGEKQNKKGGVKRVKEYIYVHASHIPYG